MNQNQKYKLREIMVTLKGQTLNAIIEKKYYDTLFYEVLECGHIQHEKSDIYGPTNAYRRRCRRCPQIAKG